MSEEHGPNAFLDLDWLCMPAPPEEAATPQHRAIDVADSILFESLDMARHVIGFSPSLRKEVLALATVHAQISAKVYATHALSAALREVTSEIMGAISEAGTDIGAGLTLGLQQALKAAAHENNGHS